MDSSIIIKNLPPGVYVPDLCYEFSYFGNIISATVHPEESRGSTWEACIAFEDNFSALQAVKRMNMHKIGNRSLRVLMSSQNERFRKVFVKNFNTSWDDCDLMKLFEDFGAIEEVKISEDKGKSNGYGHINFKSHTSAKRAIECLNGEIIDGHKIQIERFKSKSERDNLSQNSLEHVEEMLRKSAQPNNLHVKNLPINLKENEFRKLFQKFGEILSVKIMTNESGVSRGFGFVSFTKKEDAKQALERMNSYTLQGKKLQVNFKEDGRLRNTYTSLKNKAREMQIKQHKQRSQSVPKLAPYSLNNYKRI